MAAVEKSPYTPSQLNEPAQEKFENLPQAIFNQLKWMTECKDSGVVLGDARQELIESLKEMHEAEALALLKEYDQHSKEYSDQNITLLDHVSNFNSWLVGTWQGFEEGRDFGWIKRPGGGRAQRVWCHKRAMEHISELTTEEMVQFRFLTDASGKQFAADVLPMRYCGEPTGDAVLGCTNGGQDARSQRFIPPRLLLLTAGEVDVLREFNLETQPVCGDAEVDCCFVEKIFRIPSPKSAWPDEEQLFTQPAFRHDAAQTAMQDLNSVKSELTLVDIQVWKEHTRKTVLTAHVIPELRRVVNAEMSTNAFAKMYELLNAFPLVRPTAARFNTLHLCEGPGAFICATNHYIRVHHPALAWDWRACTLNPHFEANGSEETIKDDAFINETWKNWNFGLDNSGDIMNPDNIRSVWDAVRAMTGSVMLVTADGSIDCSSNPAEQERVVAPLHLSETVCALGALAVGGSFVLKMFTLLEHSSLGLLRLLSTLFGDVYATKPVMSTAGNSETYLVCLRFQGISPSLLLALLQHTGAAWPRCGANDEEAALIARAAMEEEWLEEVVTCGTFFARMQMRVVARNLRLFRSMAAADRAAIASARRTVTAEWMRRVGVVRIGEDERVVADRKLTGEAERSRMWVARQKRRLTGDLQQRREEEARRKRIKDAEASPGQLSSTGVDAGSEGKGGAKPAAGVCRVEWVRGGAKGSGAGSVRGASRAEMAAWITAGALPAEFVQSAVCSEELLLEALAARGELRQARASARAADSGARRRERADADAGAGAAAAEFVSKAATKLAEVEELCREGAQRRGQSVLAPAPDTVFVDLFGGRGGCSDYLLWKQGPRVRAGWVINRSDKRRPDLSRLRTAVAGKCSVCSGVEGAAVQADAPDDYRQLLSGELREAKGACSLVCADAVLHHTMTPRSREPASTTCALCQCWAALSLLRKGGTFVCRVEDTLGRCSSGLLLLLTACFAKLTLLKPTASSPLKPERFVVCLEFTGPQSPHVASILRHLEEAMDQSASLVASSGMNVVEVVPMRVMLQSSFVKQLALINEQHLQMEIAAIRDFLRSQESKTSSLAGEELDRQDT